MTADPRQAGLFDQPPPRTERPTVKGGDELPPRLVPARQPFRLRPMSWHWTEAAILATLAAVVAAVAYQVFR